MSAPRPSQSSLSINATASRRQWFSTATALGAAALATAISPTANGAQVVCAPRADELWFINTRNVPCGNLNESSLACWSAQRAFTGQSWQNASITDLWNSSGDGRTTVFYIHGNRINMDWAMTNGATAYQAVVRPAPYAPPPIRFVIWSWPSDRIWRPMKDARYKDDVADRECYKLGWFLGHMQPGAPVGLIGFSYGARIVTGASHLLAGGRLLGQTLASPNRPAMRSVLWAAALHNYWLNWGQMHGNAVYANDRLVNLYNTCDPALRRYNALDRYSRPQALGYTGQAHGGPAVGNRFLQRDVCCEVGRLHKMEPYASSPSVMANTREQVLWL